MKKMITIPYEEYLELTSGKVKLEENIKKHYESLIKEDEDKKNKEKLLKIINHYGVYNQQRKLQEEVFEVQDAITVYETEMLYCYDEDDLDYMKQEKEHIAEELADVMVLLEQFKLYYGITSEEITKVFWSKVDRQLERIERENEK